MANLLTTTTGSFTYFALKAWMVGPDDPSFSTFWGLSGNFSEAKCLNFGGLSEASFSGILFRSALDPNILPRIQDSPGSQLGADFFCTPLLSQVTKFFPPKKIPKTLTPQKFPPKIHPARKKSPNKNSLFEKSWILSWPWTHNFF